MRASIGCLGAFLSLDDVRVPGAVRTSWEYAELSRHGEVTGSEEVWSGPDIGGYTIYRRKFE
jgi:hypothetical protein